MRPKGAFGAAQDNLPTGPLRRSVSEASRQASRAAIWRQGEAEFPLPAFSVTIPNSTMFELKDKKAADFGGSLARLDKNVRMI